MNIYESFLYVSGKKKNQILISYKKKNYTYRDIEFKSKILRRFFLKKGINKGDVIGVIIKKSPEYLITVLALFSLGVKIVPLSRYYTIDDLNYLIAFLDMKSLITERTIEGNINCRIIKIDDTNINEEIREKEEYFEGYLYLLTSGSTGKPKVSIISERVLFFRMKSEYESFGLAAAEAINEGEVVIGSDSGGTTEILSDGKYGQLYTFGNINQLKSAIENVLQGKGTTPQKIEAAHIYLKKNFSIQNNVSNIISLYYKWL